VRTGDGGFDRFARRRFTVTRRGCGASQAINTGAGPARPDPRVLSPAVRAFLDALAELIAESILEEGSEGTPLAPEKASKHSIMTVEEL